MTLALYFIQDPDHHQHLNLAIMECDDSFSWLNQKTSIISVKTKIPTAVLCNQRREHVSM